MIASRSRVWWQHFSAAGVLVALASCSSNNFTPEAFEEIEPGAVSGELAVYIADNDDGTTETIYKLRDAKGEETPLHFTAEPKIEPGARIHVWGGPNGNGIRVEQYKIATTRGGVDIETQAQPKIGTTPNPPKNVCPALVQMNAQTGTITVAKIAEQFHTGPKSVNAFYIENSYGKDSLTGQTYGPFDYTATGTCDNSGLSKALKPMIKAQDPGCTQFSWVMVPKQGCSWSGLASVGSPTKPAQDTWYNNSIGCVVTVQEPGHNYGMNHSSSLTCSGGWYADDMSTCTHSEYGDFLDPMGGGCRHMNGYQKWYQGWMEGCNGVKTAASGTFNIMPFEQACNGLQTLELMFPAGKTRVFNRPAGGGGSAGMDTLTSYYLEYRTSAGIFDTGLTPQVLVHVGPDATQQSKGGGPHMWLVDASSTTKAGGPISKNPGMVAGGTFTDPSGGLTVTVMSMDATKAVVKVDYAAGTGGATCVDGSMFTQPGDETCAGIISGGDRTIPPPTDAGTGGTAGTGGAAGAGGTAGKGGAAGTAGTAGTGGTAGKAGAAGAGGATAGAAGTGGATAGAAGKGGGGMAGAGTGGTGTGGTAGTGTGGTTTTGGAGGATGGAGGSAGTDDTGGSAGTRTPPPTDDGGGCGCRVAAPTTSRGGLAGLLALGLGTVFASRRRRRERHR